MTEIISNDGATLHHSFDYAISKATIHSDKGVRQCQSVLQQVTKERQKENRQGAHSLVSEGRLYSQ